MGHVVLLSLLDMISAVGMSPLTAFFCAPPIPPIGAPTPARHLSRPLLSGLGGEAVSDPAEQAPTVGYGCRNGCRLLYRHFDAPVNRA
jgi:hypothetical protein